MNGLRGEDGQKGRGCIQPPTLVDRNGRTDAEREPAAAPASRDISRNGPARPLVPKQTGKITRGWYKRRNSQMTPARRPAPEK